VIHHIPLSQVVQSLMAGPVPTPHTLWQLQQCPAIAAHPLMVAVPNEFAGDPRVTDGILTIGIAAAFPGHPSRTPQESLGTAIEAILTADQMTIALAISKQRWGTDPMKQIRHLRQRWEANSEDDD